MYLATFLPSVVLDLVKIIYFPKTTTFYFLALERRAPAAAATPASPASKSLEARMAARSSSATPPFRPCPGGSGTGGPRNPSAWKPSAGKKPAT